MHTLTIPADFITRSSFGKELHGLMIGFNRVLAVVGAGAIAEQDKKILGKLGRSVPSKGFTHKSDIMVIYLLQAGKCVR